MTGMITLMITKAMGTQEITKKPDRGHDLEMANRVPQVLFGWSSIRTIRVGVAWLL